MGKRTYVLALIFMIELGFLSFKSTYALFSDNATSSNNIFAAASVFPSPSATATASASPSGSPSSSATPAPSATATIFVSDPYTCSTGASIQTVTKGTVTFTFNATTLDLTVNLVNATPSTSYDIWVNQDPGGCPLSVPTFSGGVTTDVSGNGTNSFTTSRLSGATKFWISAVAGADVFRSTAISQ